MYLPFEKALRVSFIMDGVPFDDNSKKPNEREPKFTKECNDLEIGEAMIVDQQYSISIERN